MLGLTHVKPRLLVAVLVDRAGVAATFTAAAVAAVAVQAATARVGAAPA